MRDRVMGILFILSGACFIAAVANPPLLSTWGASVSQAVSTASAHRTAWFVTTWLLALAVVAGLAAVELLARSLGTDAARVGRTLYLAGGGLALASTIWDLSVTSTLLGNAALPAWYLGGQHWADDLSTAYYALLAPAAMTCFGAAIIATRRFPRWTGVVLLIAAAALFGQFAVFRGALPFPQFLAFIALGIVALAGPRTRPPPPASPVRAGAEAAARD